MVKREVIAGLGGFATGLGLGYAVRGAVAKPAIPVHIRNQLNRLRFHDVTANVDLKGPILLSFGVEGNWDDYIVGYGLPTFLKNDIIVQIGYNRVTGTISGVIGKFCWNSVDVYMDGLKYTNFLRYGEFGVNYPGIILVLWVP